VISSFSILKDDAAQISLSYQQSATTYRAPDVKNSSADGDWSTIQDTP
jgi:hypothetical protein